MSATATDPDMAQVAEWLRTIPGYRELIKERISDARKAQREMDRRVLGPYWSGRRVLGNVNGRIANGRVCQLADCDREHYARGMCQPHYQRWRRHEGHDGIGREVEGCG